MYLAWHLPGCLDLVLTNWHKSEDWLAASFSEEYLTYLPAAWWMKERNELFCTNKD